MDFIEVKQVVGKNRVISVFPEFKVMKSKDLMVRGKQFYSVWNEDANVWETDEYEVTKLIDNQLRKYAEDLATKTSDPIQVKYLSSYSSNSWDQFKKYVASLANNSHQLDERVTFANSETKKKDYVSKRLPYSIQEGPITNYEAMISKLYVPEQRRKIEWAIGSILAGDSITIQKFLVFFGKAGSGKSTILNLIQQMFVGYTTTFEAKALTGSNNNFATEVFRTNPLVAIQHDGDLSKIEDNSKLNSIISHEDMVMNEKYKASYTSRANCFLFMGTNKPVKITDSKSGLIRRLIDVRPSNNRLSPEEYELRQSKLKFELGAIAFHCLEVYKELGINYYDKYKPLSMIQQTDIFYNFMLDSYYVFEKEGGTSLKAAYEMYKVFCDANLLDFKMPRYKFQAELETYFEKYEAQKKIDGVNIRGYFSGLRVKMFETSESEKPEETAAPSIVFTNEHSIFDDYCKDCIAQYAGSNEAPALAWGQVKTSLSDLDTSKLHYVSVPENHIVIDFDLKDESGKKNYELNLKAASKWPVTYAEVSKGGHGIHLHYIYDGDTSQLSGIYDKDIEVKVFKGKSSLRRKVNLVSNEPFRHISSGLPLKGEKMIDFTVMTNEKAIRTIVMKNLKKEYHSATRPSIDFIFKVLDDAYIQKVKYDIKDLRPRILAFAMNSTHQRDYCVKRVSQMKFTSEEEEEIPSQASYKDDELVFFDVEVFPNLFVVVWKRKGKKKVKMINPSIDAIASLCELKLVGFNCRNYDNHILYGKMLGLSNFELYKLSKRIINNSKNACYMEAYNLSYADIYEYSVKKQSLKKFEIELGILHDELNLDWDTPVPEELWERVADYCGNDVDATEIVHESRAADFKARMILSELSGLPINSKTQNHAAKIIFGNDPRPQDKFVYTDLSLMFPTYKYSFGKSEYMGEPVSEGGEVYSEPGMYENVALLDVESMHPTSLIQLDHFGPYTDQFASLKDARLAIKHRDLEAAKKMLNGILAKYLGTEQEMDELSYALKIIINIVYGMTSASYDNKFKMKENVDNIVAKRGSLFMIDLKHEVQEKGYTVAHIKTDSIKIPNADEYIIKHVKEFGLKYGYTFEHEATYSKMCLVNKAVYIAKVAMGKHEGEWSPTGAQFAEPYVFKTLFDKDSAIEFSDKCVTKQVKAGTMFLDMSGVTGTENDLRFIGKVEKFCPMKPGTRGGQLLRVQDDKQYAVTGTKGYIWLTAKEVSSMRLEKDIDESYFKKLVDSAIDKIAEYGNTEWFFADTPYVKQVEPEEVPWD